MLLLRPLDEYEADNTRNPRDDCKNSSQWSCEVESCIEKSQPESETDQTERNFESSPI